MRAVEGMILASASQISLFDEEREGCERKWGWKYLAKLPDPPGPGALLGTEVDDKQLQPYLGAGRPLDFTRHSGYVAATGLAFLPKPMTPGMGLQTHCVLPSPSPLPDGGELRFQGYLDIWTPDGSVWPEASFDPKEGSRDSRIPVVGDSKTTGNWKYQKHAADLKTDVQAMLYATWAMRVTGSRVVDLIWVYFGTKGALKARRSHARIYADDVAEQFERINRTALRIYDARKNVTDPLQLKPNPKTCGAFGGCPYQAKCNLAPSELIDATAAQHWARQEKSDMSNTSTGAGLSGLAKLRAAKAAQGAPAAAPAVTAAGIPVENLPAWATAPTDPLTGKSATPVPLGINPPESTLPPAPAVGAVTAPSAAAPVEGAEAPKRRGPGRPKKDPTGADAMAHTAPKLTDVDHGGQAAADRGVAACEVIEGEIVERAITGAGAQVRVVWGQETICPVAYNPFVIGPFEATGYVQPGETIGQAQARIYLELELFAESARQRKAESFATALGGIGGGK